jgi:hypothetical protein
MRQIYLYLGYRVAYDMVVVQQPLIAGHERTFLSRHFGKLSVAFLQRPPAPLSLCEQRLRRDVPGRSLVLESKLSCVLFKPLEAEKLAMYLALKIS